MITEVSFRSVAYGGRGRGLAVRLRSLARAPPPGSKVGNAAASGDLSPGGTCCSIRACLQPGALFHQARLLPFLFCFLFHTRLNES